MKRMNFICIFLFLITFGTHPSRAQTYTPLYTFQGSPDGADPQGGLSSYGGNLYGVTAAGGTGGAGTVFELSPNGVGGWNESVLYNFCSLPSCADGSTPSFANVIFDSPGNMYGTAWSGGAHNHGVVWELSPSETDWKETVLHSFRIGNGVGGLVMDSSGNLYGCTHNGLRASSVFELSPSRGHWTEKIIQNIDGTYSGLAIDSAANLFGSTLSTVYELSPDGSGGWNGSIIYKFEPDENGESETPTLDSAGNIYGTTESGGHLDYGAVWELTPVTSGQKRAAWTEKILHYFRGYQNSPSFPQGGVVLDAAGNIYGTSGAGGYYQRGTIYELVPTGTGQYEETILWSFDPTTGNFPEGSLILDSSGNLYGTTGAGGADSVGVVFELVP